MELTVKHKLKFYKKKETTDDLQLHTTVEN